MLMCFPCVYMCVPFIFQVYSQVPIIFLRGMGRSLPCFLLQYTAQVAANVFFCFLIHHAYLIFPPPCEGAFPCVILQGT